MKLFAFALVAFGGLAYGQLQPGIANADPGGGNLPIQKIGADDLIAVSVYDAPELTRTIRVNPEGLIRMPMLKEPIRAAGLLPSELEAVIATVLKDAELIADPFVTVTVSEYHSRPVSVMGAVRLPVTFQAAGEVTLLDALARAGGLTPEAGNEILLSHPGADGQAGLIQRIPVKVLIDAADPTVNVKLRGGEQIRVPEAGRIFIIGQVRKPGSFSAHDDGEATVLKALAYAEGLLPYSGKQAYIYRRDGPGSKREIVVPLKLMMDRKAPDVALAADDILYIPEAKGTRMTLAALEKVLLVGSGMATALVYVGVK
jgi:polysaccharide export outer membrane protein